MVKYIEIDDKRYPLTLDFTALMETEEATGKGLKDFQDFRLKDYLVLFHHMLISGAREKGEKYASDISHSQKLLNGCFGEFTQELVPAFFEQLLAKRGQKTTEAL